MDQNLAEAWHLRIEQLLRLVGQAVGLLNQQMRIGQAVDHHVVAMSAGTEKEVVAAA